MHHYQSNYSILQHAIFGICVFCESTLFVIMTLGVGVETMYFFYNANVFSVVDNIL